jgi:hypothetical protein
VALIPRAERILVLDGAADKAKAGCRKFCNLYERIVQAKVRLFAAGRRLARAAPCRSRWYTGEITAVISDVMDR